MRRAGPIGLWFWVAAWLPVAAQVPAPFPQPPSSPPPRPAQLTPASPAGELEPTEAALGFPIYPNARFLISYNATRGQRYYLFGSEVGFAVLVNYYRTVLKTRGTLVFDAPPTHIFEIGRFREDTMAFPPSVTIKDYTWGGSPGYLNPRPGDGPERFPAIIQIVPAPVGQKP